MHYSYGVNIIPFSYDYAEGILPPGYFSEPAQDVDGGQWRVRAPVLRGALAVTRARAALSFGRHPVVRGGDQHS